MRSNTFKLFFWTLIFLVLGEMGWGQGWRKTYDFDQLDFAHTLLQTEDGGFLLTGSRLLKTNGEGVVEWVAEFPNGVGIEKDNGGRKALELSDGSLVVITNEFYEKILLIKYSNNGSLIWSKEYDFGVFVGETSIAATPDGGFIFSLNCDDGVLPSCTIFAKTDNNGNIEWQKNIGALGELLTVQSIIPLTSGGFAITGEQGSINGAGPYVARLDGFGNTLWRKDWFAFTNCSASYVTETSDNQFLVFGYWNDIDFGLTDSKLFIAKLDGNGSETWFKLFEEMNFFYSHDAVLLADDNLVLTGTFNFGLDNQYGAILKIDENGNKMWQRNYDNYSHKEQFHSIVLTPDGGFAVAGLEDVSLGFSQYNTLLIKTDPLGNIFSHTLLGKAFQDQNLNCLSDLEPGLQNFVIKAEGTETFYGYTDTAGNYEMLVDTGTYEISIAPIGYWETCEPSYPVLANSLYDTTTLYIPLLPTANCPFLLVDISTPFLRLCNSGHYAVSYCNNGTIPAENATVEITLDPDLQYISATAPLLSQNGQTLLFDLGDVGINECGGFSLHFEVGCDSTLFGQTLCTEAHIFPDSICNNTWTGANLEVAGICEGDSVHFTITNTGGDMPQSYEYIVIEDNIILMTNDFQLTENEQFTFTSEAKNGATYFMVAAQDINLPPIFGNPVATAAVEGCVGNVNPGVFNQLPLDDGEPWLSIDCHPVIASYDPNDKTAFPSGWNDEHFIEARTGLDYLIRFQNTGTDTAFKVVLVDTLSPFLDPATILPGSSSHPYTFELGGQGVAKFIFDNILLPDSTTNEAASHGWVKFRIAQKPGNQPGTVIENTAGIYFDFNAPVLTNTTFHTIREPWVGIVSGSVEVFFEKMAVKISPNPMGDWAIFEVKNLPQGENTLSVFDLNGRAVSVQKFTQGKSLVQRGGMVAGIYFFKIENGGRLLATGKMVVR